MSDAEDEYNDDGDIPDETEIFYEDSDQDAIETNIHPRTTSIIPESDCKLDIEIVSNNDFSSEDDDSVSSFVSSWGKLTTIA
jgi:hypothetical protein